MIKTTFSQLIKNLTHIIVDKGFEEVEINMGSKVWRKVAFAQGFLSQIWKEIHEGKAEAFRER